MKRDGRVWSPKDLVQILGPLISYKMCVCRFFYTMRMIFSSSTLEGILKKSLALHSLLINGTTCHPQWQMGSGSSYSSQRLIVKTSCWDIINGLLHRPEIGLVDSLGTESFDSIPPAAKLLFQLDLSYCICLPSI